MLLSWYGLEFSFIFPDLLHHLIIICPLNIFGGLSLETWEVFFSQFFLIFFCLGAVVNLTSLELVCVIVINLFIEIWLWFVSTMVLFTLLIRVAIEADILVWERILFYKTLSYVFCLMISFIVLTRAYLINWDKSIVILSSSSPFCVF